MTTANDEVPPPPTVLGYAVRRRRRTWRWVVAALLVATAAWAAVRYRAPARAWFDEQSAQWRYRAAFDATERALAPDADGYWLARGDGDPSADAQLAALVAVSAGQNPTYYAGAGGRPNVVAFARAGTTGGQRWLAFACASTVGLETFVFNRGERAAGGYHRHATTVGLWGRPIAPVVRATATRAGPDAVDVALNYDGARNQVEWRVVADASTAPRLATATVNVLTGWTDPVRADPAFTYDWWPNAGGVTLHDGAAAPRRLDAAGPPASPADLARGAELCFVGDDGARLARATPTQLAVVDVASGARRATRALPPLAELRHDAPLAFRPDGRQLVVVGNLSDDVLIVDLVADGDAAPATRTAKAWAAVNPKIHFVGGEIWLLGNRWHVVEAATGASRPHEWADRNPGVLARSADGTTTAHAPAGHLGARVERAGAPTLWITNEFSSPNDLALSPDGRWLAAVANGGFALFDARSGARTPAHVASMSFHVARNAIRWSPDGRLCAVPGGEHVYVWALGASGPEWAARLPFGPGGSVVAVAFAPDSRGLAATGTGGSAIAHWPDVRAATQPSAARAGVSPESR